MSDLDKKLEELAQPSIVRSPRVQALAAALLRARKWAGEVHARLRIHDCQEAGVWFHDTCAVVHDTELEKALP